MRDICVQDKRLICITSLFLHKCPACREYLGMASEAAASSEMQEAVEKSETNATPLGSFPAIFAHSLAFGTLSRRRIYSEAQRALQDKSTLQRLTGKLKTAQSASVTAEAADFHWHIARAGCIQSTRTGTVPRHWRWRVCTFHVHKTGQIGSSPSKRQTS